MPRPPEQNSGGGADAPQLLLRVVRGDATEAEVAAVVSVLLASRASGSMVRQTQAPARLWGHNSAAVRRPLPHGPGAWRGSRSIR